LLFEKPKGSRYPLLINAFGSVRRMALALEVNELDEVAERIQGFLKMETPQGFFRQGQDAAEARGAWIVLSEEREDRRVQGSDPEGKRRQPF